MMWWKSLLKVKNDEKAVSSIVGGLIMISALFGFTTYVLAHKARQGQMQAQGLIDTMRQAEKRQAQLIDFSYAEEQGGDLHVYVSNYGWEDAVVEKAWVAGESVSVSNILTVAGESTGDMIPSRSFVKIIVSNLPSDRGSEYAFAFLTESNSVYKWKAYAG